ncbi:MAG: YbaK/EbsC family protein [Candidatus Caldarchaeum sp.]
MLGPEDLKKFMEAKGVTGEFIHLKPHEAKTSVSAAAAVNCDVSRIAKNIVLVGSRAYVLVISGDKKIDLEKFSKAVNENVRLAKPDEVLRITGYAVGGVPPFGHLDRVKIFVDSSVKRHDFVYTSGGADNMLLKIRVDALLNVAEAEVVDVSK